MIKLMYKFSVTFNKRYTITVDIDTPCYEAALDAALDRPSSCGCWGVSDCCSISLEYAYPTLRCRCS